MNEYGAVIGPKTVRFERLLPGPVERVWSYLAESEKRGTWLATGEIEPRVGGKVELTFINSELTESDEPPPPQYATCNPEMRVLGRVLVYDPPRRLSYTWGENLGEPSEVTFELTQRDTQVLLIVTHRRLETRDLIICVAAGWHTHLGILADHFAGAKPAGFWSTFTRLEGEYGKRIPAGAEV
jgi:uncharacterized protein YndB with AHSA1/START domain